MRDSLFLTALYPSHATAFSSILQRSCSFNHRFSHSLEIQYIRLPEKVLIHSKPSHSSWHVQESFTASVRVRVKRCTPPHARLGWRCTRLEELIISGSGEVASGTVGNPGNHPSSTPASITHTLTNVTPPPPLICSYPSSFTLLYYFPVCPFILVFVCVNVFHFAI